jgi:hypothetical protein
MRSVFRQKQRYGKAEDATRAVSAFLHRILPGESEPEKDSRKHADIFAAAPAVNRKPEDL